MKLMKYTYLFGVVALAASLAACTDEEPKYTPATPEPNPAVFFSLSDVSSVEINEESTSVTVKLYRPDGGPAETVPVTASVTPATPLFSFPASAVFADGADVADYTVTFPANALDAGDYNFEFAVGNGAESPYWTQKLDYVATYISWLPVTGVNADGVEETTATYREDFMTTFFNVENVEYQLQLQYNPADPGIYRLVNPYGEAYPYNTPGDYSEDTHYWYFNCKNPNKVFICNKNGEITNPNNKMYTFYTGMDWGYGEVVITGLANYYAANPTKGSPDAYYGTFKDGILTFPKEALMIAMLDYNNGGLYSANTNGKFRIIWPGVEELADPNDRWESLGNATFTDGMVYPVLTGGEMLPEMSNVYEVEVTQYLAEPGLYHLVNPWKTGVCPYGVAYDGDLELEIDASNENAVLLPLQETGLANDEGAPLCVTNFAYFALATGQATSLDQIINAGLNDTFENGEFSFKPGTILFGFLGADGNVSVERYQNWSSRIVLAGSPENNASAFSAMSFTNSNVSSIISKYDFDLPVNKFMGPKLSR